MIFDLLDFLCKVDMFIVCNVIELIEGKCGFDCFMCGMVLCSDL